MNDATIAKLPGLGPKSQTMLAGAGITTLAQLQGLGSVRAYAMVKATGSANFIASVLGISSPMTMDK